MDENLLLSLIENNAKMEVVDLAAALNEKKMLIRQLKI